ncbi:MAG: PspC domain-containing protein [Pseudobutyrivibrio sp.]|nr:PspC domain-containing protein [Pseudobutyrivibrio sp.]
MNKRLYKSSNKKICGVCGGIGEYLGVDPTFIRLLWIIFACVAGSGLLAYIIAAIIMDDDPNSF